MERLEPLQREGPERKAYTRVITFFMLELKENCNLATVHQIRELRS